MTADEIIELRDQEIAQLKADNKALKGFADLWYFVMENRNAMAFEKIVCDYSPSAWLQQAYKLSVERGL